MDTHILIQKAETERETHKPSYLRYIELGKFIKLLEEFGEQPEAEKPVADPVFERKFLTPERRAEIRHEHASRAAAAIIEQENQAPERKKYMRLKTFLDDVSAAHALGMSDDEIAAELKLDKRQVQECRYKKRLLANVKEKKKRAKRGVTLPNYSNDAHTSTPDEHPYAPKFPLQLSKKERKELEQKIRYFHKEGLWDNEISRRLNPLSTGRTVQRGTITNYRKNLGLEQHRAPNEWDYLAKIRARVGKT